ncbi:class I SAM-dependent methyltransferase [Streptococcus dentapri]|uniref:Class I SAM-dependent methyltransferase n=1 Tax=Streptococcus dentapri TaxID=573564 RepID=A0ABV8CYS0_9STRE
MDFIVTTSLGQNPSLVQQARELAQQYGVIYIERRKRSIRKLLAIYDKGILTVYQDQLVFVNRDGSKLYFHPDTAMLRIKAQHDPLLDLLGVTPKIVLDTTMGIASDSLVMAYAGHLVTALESNPLIYLVVSQGLQRFVSENPQLNQAMRSIKTINQEATSYLSKQPDKSIDIVYIDPMFSEKIVESSNLEALSPLANTSPLSYDLMKEAQRVAKEKIIIKAHFRDSVFEEFGFERQLKPSQKFHYGFKKLI